MADSYNLNILDIILLDSFAQDIHCNVRHQFDSNRHNFFATFLQHKGRSCNVTNFINRLKLFNITVCSLRLYFLFLSSHIF